MNEITKQQLLAIIGEESDIEVEIDQDLYPKPEWGVDQIVRSSGLVEDICEHGCGHPNAEWLRINDPNDETGLSIHGCCGCCCPDMKEAIKKNHEENQSHEPFQELWDNDLRKKVMKEYDEEEFI